MEMNPNHVLVLGQHDDAVRMGTALRRAGVAVTCLADMDDWEAKGAPLTDGSCGAVDLVLFGVNPDCALVEAQRLERRVAPETPVIALLPGIRRLAWTANAAPRLQWIRCVVRSGAAFPPPQTPGDAGKPLLCLTANSRLAQWRGGFERAGYAVDLRPDMRAVQWGHTLLQLAALAVLASGRSHTAWLNTRSSRTELARLWDETLDLLRLSGVEPVPMLGMPWRVASMMLKMGDAPFSWLAERHFSAAQAEIAGLVPSRKDQLELLIDASCGEVMRLAIGLGEDAPRAVRLAEQLTLLYRVAFHGADASLAWDL